MCRRWLLVISGKLLLQSCLKLEAHNHSGQSHRMVVHQLILPCPSGGTNAVVLVTSGFCPCSSNSPSSHWAEDLSLDQSCHRPADGNALLSWLIPRHKGPPAHSPYVSTLSTKNTSLHRDCSRGSWCGVGRYCKAQRNPTVTWALPLGHDTHPWSGSPFQLLHFKSPEAQS